MSIDRLEVFEEFCEEEIDIRSERTGERRLVEDSLEQSMLTCLSSSRSHYWKTFKTEICIVDLMFKNPSIQPRSSSRSAIRSVEETLIRGGTNHKRRMMIMIKARRRYKLWYNSKEVDRSSAWAQSKRAFFIRLNSDWSSWEEFVELL